jgi:SMP-30/Gluconolaconase/LRE-like region.
MRFLIALMLLVGLGFATNIMADDAPVVQTSKLFVSLPDYCPTPDGMAIDSEGNLVVACPNYADKSKPACVIKIDKQGNVKKWFNVPTIPETGFASPMGIAFGPEGELYICDNQGWMGTEEGQFKGRLLECRIEGMGDSAKVKTRVIADSIEHPNGVRYHKGKLYITNSLMVNEKDPSGLLVSGVYCFDPKATKTVTVTNTKKDPNLLLSVLTYNRDCQYGLDGIAFDSKGVMRLGNFGDGSILRVELADNGKVSTCETWAKDLKNLRTTDGICFDENDNLYIADFSENAIAVVKPDSRVYRIAQSPDSDGAKGELDQPGEPIVWNGKLYITCFDCVTGPDKVNTKHQPPYTITTLELVK